MPDPEPIYISRRVWEDLLGVGLPPPPQKSRRPPETTDTSPEALRRYRESYQKKCASCGGPLGGPGTDEELREQCAEHDQNFPGMSLETSVTICDDCYSPPGYYDAWRVP